MKSKMKIALIALVLPMIALIFGVDAHATRPTSDAPQVPANAVAVFVGGVPHALTNRLVMQFPGGGAITSISFQQGISNWWMVRSGNYNSGYRTEKFQVSISNGFLLYQPVMVNFCYSPECRGCEYKQIEQRCECRLMDPAYPSPCQLYVIQTLPLDQVVVPL